MDDAAQASQFYIPARTSLDREGTARLKHDDTFAVFDGFGDVLAFEGNPDGVYHKDTRHLSHFELRLNGARPLLLSSTVQNDNAALVVDLTNPDFPGDARRPGLVRDLIHIHRLKFLWRGALYERIAVFNYDDQPHDLAISALFSADFADLFEARGQHRGARGVKETYTHTPCCVRHTYLGLDGVQRVTQFDFDPPPNRLDVRSAVYEFRLAPQERKLIFLRIDCTGGALPALDGTEFLAAMTNARRELGRLMAPAARISSSSTLFDEVVGRAMADLAMLVTHTPEGPFPYAGIPWFSTAFGRDSLITALFMTWAHPEIARGVLRHLARHQATEVDEFRDAEPGKILHERRLGEMAALREIPFGEYYGSVDATPLFVCLAGAYLDRTGDLATLRELWPAVQAALAWIEAYGDLDGDGFVEYARQRETGLVNQGWKDSHDSVSHADGRLAEGPIALCEVQAYVYGAWCAAARLAGALGRTDQAIEFEAKATELRQRFDKAFWIEELGTYALALDGAKEPCRVVSSNAGHALFTGIALPQRAERLAQALMSPASFCGWGVRTLAAHERRYNPMSYHNGSVWPHDNGLIALGLARYGLKAPVLRLTEGLFDAASFAPLRRLPELFCGFNRTRRKGPTRYPVACAPQAWAAATPIALLAASLGLGIDHAEKEVRLVKPALPPSLSQVRISHLSVGEGMVDLLVARHGESVSVTVLDRVGDVRVSVTH